MFLEFIDIETMTTWAIRKSEIVRIEIEEVLENKVTKDDHYFCVFIHTRKYVENIDEFHCLYRTPNIVEALKEYSRLLKVISDESTTKKNSPEIEELLCKNIKHLKLSYRPYHCLKRIGIATIRDLIKYIDKKPSRLYDRIDNFGRKSSYETIQALESKGLSIYTEV